MKAGRRVARKRAVNLTFNEDLVQDANTITDNRCGVAQSLLPESAVQELKHRSAETKALEATILMWNEFNAKSGSITDEFVTL